MKKLLKWFVVPALMMSMNAFAQQDTNDKKVAPNDWHLLDKTTDGYYGISLNKAYNTLKKMKSREVIVAVIDSGIDTTHEDLKPVLWHNPGETPGNGQDDDNDGYTDNVYGWNFLGNQDGKNVKEDTYEAARAYWNYKHIFDGAPKDTTKMSPMEKYQYNMWLRAQKDILKESNSMEISMAKRMLPILEAGNSVIVKDLGKEKYDGTDLDGYTPTSQEAAATASILQNIQQMNDNPKISNEDILNQLRGEVRKAEAATKAPETFRADIVQDSYHDFTDKFYGNGDVMAGTPTHGTHVSGIIGAARHNGLGMDGIADNVKIMMIRAVPDGDEHDKDIALAIRYAVDKGAKVINMSFGKGYSPQKDWVDDAVKYAAEHDVLLVHAAGNDSKNIDSTENYPSADFLFGEGVAKNMITVGASGDPSNGGITARFSNYGKRSVDVFAPGVQIYATLPGGNAYGKLSGTSMASPVTAGVAALIRSYFPNLSAEEVKQVIVSSVMPITEEVALPGTQGANPTMVHLSDISVGGGIVNAYNAVEAAKKIKPKKK